MKKATIAGVVVAGALACGAGFWFLAGFTPALIGLGGAIHEGPSDTPGARPAGADPVPQTLRRYVFRWQGDESDLPWNRALYFRLEKAGKWQPPMAGIFFIGEENAVPVTGAVGARWIADSEEQMPRGLVRTMWSLHVEGTFGEEDTIGLPLPRRARVRLTGDELGGSGEDLLTVTDEEGGGRLVISRQPLQALRFAVWDASQPPAKQDWHGWPTIAPPLPWVCNEIRPGAKLVLAAKRAGRQWIARRTELAAGEEFVLDVAAAPEGGGTVRCDDPDAELLLGGDLPIPGARIVEVFYRAVWRDVPAGKHAVRFPGGRRVEIEVADGAELTVK